MEYRNTEIQKYRSTEIQKYRKIIVKEKHRAVSETDSIVMMKRWLGFLRAETRGATYEDL